MTRVMTGIPTTEKIGSISQIDGADPWAYSARLRDAGDIVWDEELQSWLVSSYDLVREVLRKDEQLFQTTLMPRDGQSAVAGVSAEEWIEYNGGHELGALLISGEEHERIHRWWMHMYTPKLLESLRDAVIAPVCHTAIDAFADRGCAEIVEEYAHHVTPRTMMAMLGLPYEDDAWVSHLLQLFATRHLLRQTQSLPMPPDPEVRRAAFAANDEMRDLILPYVRERKSGNGEDFISMVWREGADVFGAQHGEAAVLSTIIAWWAGGAGTVAKGIANGLYLAVAQEYDREPVVEGDKKALRVLVEESLRLYGPTYWIGRIAKAETSLGGMEIKQGDQVLLMLVSAARDPDHYAHPDGVDMERRSLRDHFAFGSGPRACPGHALGRAELEEMIGVLLARLPDIELDATKPPPRYQGFTARSWGPLHVTFSA